MEIFKKKMFARLCIMVTGLLGAAAAIMLSSRFEKPESGDFLRGFTGGFQTGLSACLLGVLLFLAIRYLRALNDPEKLKKQYISETDERKLFIKQKTGDTGMNIITYGLVTCTAVSGNINDTVFLTLLCVTFFITAVRGFFKIYYNKVT